MYTDKKTSHCLTCGAAIDYVLGAPPKYCDLHVHRWNLAKRLANRSNRKSRPTLRERFWAQVPTVDGDGCWEWQGARFRSGYGRFRAASASLRAHRVAFEFAVGAIPDGMVVCHHCDNPLCVRPAHLFLGTQKDNIRDMIEKGRRSTRRTA